LATFVAPAPAEFVDEPQHGRGRCLVAFPGQEIRRGDHRPGQSPLTGGADGGPPERGEDGVRVERGVEAGDQFGELRQRVAGTVGARRASGLAVAVPADDPPYLAAARAGRRLVEAG